MLENIVRHVEEGMEPFEAAVKGAREVGFTIISISLSLVAVFIPIFFMPGVIGGLFREFAIVVSLAILVSAHRLAHAGADARQPLPQARARGRPGRCAGRRGSSAATSGRCARYERALDWCLDAPRAWCSAIAIATPRRRPSALFICIPKGFFPTEDIGQIIVRAEAVEDISFPAMVADAAAQVSDVLRANPAVASVIAQRGRHQHRAHVHQPEAARRARRRSRRCSRSCGATCAGSPA